MVARYSAQIAAEVGGGTAVQLGRERRLQLDRALARYERHAAAAQAGWPRAPWAPFLHAAQEWHHRYPARTIVALDQLTRRMRPPHR